MASHDSMIVMPQNKNISTQHGEKPKPHHSYIHITVCFKIDDRSIYQLLVEI